MVQLKITFFRLVLLCLYFLPSTGFADRAPPPFDSADWQQLMQRITSHGVCRSLDDGVHCSLTRSEPADATKAHLYNAITSVGYLDGPTFVPEEVIAVSENWTITPAGDWNIDQWLYVLTIGGKLTSESHIALVETLDHEVLGDQIIPNGGASDPAVLAGWAQTLQAWYAQLP